MTSTGPGRLEQGSSLFDKRNKYHVQVAIGALTGLTLGSLYYHFNVSAVSLPEPAADRVLRAFEEGRGLDIIDLKRDRMIDRKNVVDKVLSNLQPKECYNSYVVVMGASGSGKTTAVRQALSALETPKGAVYIDCPVEAKTFSAKLARLIGYRTNTGAQLDELMAKCRHSVSS
jgi:hypothetical protein